MSDMNISLNNIQKTKTVNIDGVGVLKVRRIGAGEELDLSRNHRRLSKIIKELSQIDFMQFNSAKPEDVKKIEKLNKRVDEISDEISEIKKFEYETYKRCLSDDENGKVVDVIMNTLTEEERSELFKQIFSTKKQVEVADSVSTDDVENISDKSDE